MDFSEALETDNYIAMTNQLLEVDVPENEPTLFQAVRYLDYDMIDRQIREGVDINTKVTGTTPYRLKCVSPDNSFSVSMSHYSPLHLAILHAPLKVIELLLARGADINIRDGQQRTPLHLAVVTNRLAVIRFLIEHGADKDVQSSSGRTPILQAMLNSNRNCVQLLLQLGADPNLMDLKGTSVLSSLTFTHVTDLHLLGLLLKSNCDVNISNGMGGTPLMYAATMKKIQVMEMLLEAGANINQRDKNGCSALHLISKGNRMSARASLFLIHHGADAEMPDKKGVSVLQKAVSSGNGPMIRLLLTLGVPMDVDILEHPSVKKICDFLPDFKSWITGELSNPKDLKRLCRQKVRQCLSPDRLTGVKSLDLPKILCDYLLGRDINDRYIFATMP